jgi:predicted RNA polymerase sigma factor
VGDGDATGWREARSARIFREESGRSVAALIRAFGDIDLAEDAVQDAFAVALRTCRAMACRPIRAAGSPWPQIVALYDQLLVVAPTPVVALNRAIAIGELEGPAAAGRGAGSG